MARKQAAPAKTPARGNATDVAEARREVSPLDVMPLDVMLGAMRELWARAESLRGRRGCEAERLALIRQASAEAHKAAVYVHPRMASVEVEGAGKDASGKASGDFGPARKTRALGGRELARRLLFAVAIAEHSPAIRGAAGHSPAIRGAAEHSPVIRGAAGHSPAIRRAEHFPSRESEKEKP